MHKTSSAHGRSVISLGVLATAIVAQGVFAIPAQATWKVVSVTQQGTLTYAGGTERNDVVMDVETGGGAAYYTITDRVPVKPGTECYDLDGAKSNNTVWCDAKKIKSIFIRTGAGDDKVDLRAGDKFNVRATLWGEDGADKLEGGKGNDDLDGGRGNDELKGYKGDDKLSGAMGDDKLYGWLGNDRLSGGNGNDQLFGYMGDDHLDGNSGKNHIDGGIGKDTCINGPTKVNC